MHAGTPLTKDHPDERVSLFQDRGRNVLTHLVVFIKIKKSGERYAGGGIYIYTYNWSVFEGRGQNVRASCRNYLFAFNFLFYLGYICRERYAGGEIHILAMGRCLHGA